MEKRARRRALLFSWTGAATLLGALAAANLLAYFLFARVDFSANRAYSISRGTKDLLKSLDDALVVKVYYTPHLPPPYGLARQYLKDLLAEYKSAGRGKVQVEFLDPDQGNIRREAMEAGVAPLQMSVMGRDKFEIKESFMGAVFFYKGKTEVIPVISGVENLEYDLTRRIKKLVSKRLMTAGFVTGHGEAAPAEGAYGPLFEHVREQMNVQTVSLDKPVPAEVDALWIWGPNAPFKPDELERLKAWVGSGRSLGILLSLREVDLRNFLTRPVATGLEGLLAQWGMEVQDGFVVDAQAERIQLESTRGFFSTISIVDYPFIPIATGMNRGHPAVRGLSAVSFPFVHPVRVLPGAKTGLAYTSLVDSSKSSWRRTDAMVQPGMPIDALQTKEQGPFSLAGVLEGDFFKVTPTTGTVPHTGRLILVGTAKQVQPQFSGKPVSAAFLLNLLEWSLQDQTLLSIRSKSAGWRPLRSLPAAAMFLVKYSLIFFLPMALAAGGLWLRSRRLAARRLLAKTYDDA